MKKLLLFLPFLFLLSCTSNKNTPEYAAKQYLTALKNKDWETAMKYATPATANQIDMMRSLGTDFGITEVRDIKCEVKGGGTKAMCTFCCSEDTGFNKILITLNDKNEWKANQSKGSWLDYNYWDRMK